MKPRVVNLAVHSGELDDGPAVRADSELSFCHRPLPSPIIYLTDLRRSGSRTETENAVAAIDFCYTVIARCQNPPLRPEPPARSSRRLLTASAKTYVPASRFRSRWHRGRKRDPLRLTPYGAGRQRSMHADARTKPRGTAIRRQTLSGRRALDAWHPAAALLAQTLQARRCRGSLTDLPFRLADACDNRCRRGAGGNRRALRRLLPGLRLAVLNIDASGAHARRLIARELAGAN